MTLIGNVITFLTFLFIGGILACVMTISKANRCCCWWAQ